MGAGRSGYFRGTRGGRTTLHADRQGKHIVGNKNYIPGKSIFIGTLKDAQQLIREFSGYGTSAGENRERVDFGKIIGYYIDPQTGKKYPTTMGIIHYSKDGAHIVPSKPKKER